MPDYVQRNPDGTDHAVDQGFLDTIDHALLVHRKIQLLQEQLRNSLAVAASMSGYMGCHLSSPQVLLDAVLALRAQEVPGRGGVSSNAPSMWIVRYSLWKVGTTHVLTRAERLPWPGRNLPCAYVLASEDGSLLYIGKTANLRARMGAHRSKPWATCTVTFCADDDEALRLEGDLIFQHQPPLNKADRSRRRFVRPS